MMTSNINSNTKAQGFKKKTSTTNADFSNTKPTDKLSDLKSKLQKEKEMMRKTGKRFREDTSTSMSTQQISIQTDKEIQISGNENQNQNLNKHDISIGSEEPIKQTISLKDLSIGDQSARKDSMMTSQLFEKQVKQQKKRSTEVYNFLKTLQLEMFAEPLIQIGFDEVQTLADLTTQDMNSVMMRAHQQIKLQQSIKSLHPSTHPTKPHNQFTTTSTIWHTKTEPMQDPSSSRGQRIKSSQIIARLKTEHGKKEQQKSTSFLSSSFLYTVGSRNWSVEDQVRRACSVCFKVEQQMEKKGQCYYCSNCFKFVSEDLLQISLGKSMNKQYRKYQKQ